MSEGKDRKVHEEMLYDYEKYHDNLIINHCNHFMQLSINHLNGREGVSWQAYDRQLMTTDRIDGAYPLTLWHTLDRRVDPTIFYEQKGRPVGLGQHKGNVLIPKATIAPDLLLLLLHILPFSLYTKDGVPTYNIDLVSCTDTSVRPIQ
jgi:hypothetical protein